MRRATITDVVPINVNGETVYMETRFRGLGVTQAVTTTTTNISNTIAAASAVVDALPQKITVQSDFSKTANVVATGAGVVAAAVVYIVPWGTAVAAVAGLVAGAAALLGKIFANSKAKAYAAERGQYEAANAELKYENQELDQKYDQVNKAMDQLRIGVAEMGGKSIDTSIRGLGLCLSKCKEEKEKLQSAKNEYELLVKMQSDKTQAMASLLEEYNKLVKTMFDLAQGKKVNDYLIWGLIGTAVVVTGYLIFKSKSK